jgi:hypothetical protein
VVERRDYGGDSNKDHDGSTDDPLPFGGRYDEPDPGGEPYLNVDLGFEYRDALVHYRLALHGDPQAYAQVQELLARLESADVELPSGDLVLSDVLLLVAEWLDIEAATHALESDRHLRCGLNLFELRFAASAEVFEKFRIHLESAGYTYLDSLCLPKPHLLWRIKQQLTFIDQLSDGSAYLVVVVL